LIKKILVIVLVSSFTSPVFAAYLDDWSNDDLCGWTNSSSIPEHIQIEVDKREIICYGGVEVYSLPSKGDNSSTSGTAFPSPDQSLIEKLKLKYDQEVGKEGPTY
jgi:hypothetical protein